MNQINTQISNILKVATPLVIAGIAMHLVGVVDIMLVSNLGDSQIGGTGNGQILYSLLVVIGMGVTSGVQIVISRRNGAQKFTEIGNLFWQGLYFVLFFATILFLFIHLSIQPLLSVIFESESVVKYSTIYITTRGYGFWFTLINTLFVGFYVGITKTRVLGIFTPVISLVNILLDIILINGWGSIPAMGVEGAAIASVMSEGIGTAVFIGYTLKVINLKKYALHIIHKFNKKATQQILQLSGPIMLQNGISIGAWFMFFTFVESLGERALAISQIIRGIYIFLMVPVFSLADAANTFVSNLMGELRFNAVIPLVARVCGVGVVVNLIFFFAINLFPETVISLFSSNTELIAQTIPPLRLTTIGMFLFTLSFIPFRSVSGTGNTKTALAIESVSVFAYLSYAYYVAEILHLNLVWVWSSEFAYFILLLILSWAYLKYGDWKSKTV